MSDDLSAPDPYAQYSRFAKEFSTESDRGLAVLALCVLEDALRDGIKRKLGTLYSDELMRILAPQGRWGVLAATATMLALVAQEERSDLDLLVKVRNRFAHRAVESLSFEHPDIAALVDQMNPQRRFPRRAGARVNHRSDFLIVLASTYMVAVWRATQAPPTLVHATPILYMPPQTE